MFRVTMLSLLLSACASFNPELLSNEQKFRVQACITVYCENSENNAVKNAGLRLIEIAAATQGADLKLDRGFCEKYFSNRELQGGFIYAKKSAKEICEGESE